LIILRYSTNEAICTIPMKFFSDLKSVKLVEENNDATSVLVGNMKYSKLQLKNCLRKSHWLHLSLFG